MPLSLDLDALATTFARYCVGGGRTMDMAACRAFHHIFADLADQARALEGRQAPRVIYGENVVPLPLRPRQPAGDSFPGGSAA